MRRLFLWVNRDSNPGPSACKADALNQLSYSPYLVIPFWECKYTTKSQIPKSHCAFMQKKTAHPEGAGGWQIHKRNYFADSTTSKPLDFK